MSDLSPYYSGVCNVEIDACEMNVHADLPSVLIVYLQCTYVVLT